MVEKDIEVRKAREEDIKKILELDKKASKEIKWWESLKISEVKRLLKQKKCLYVAEYKKEIIGFLTADIKENCIILNDIFVIRQFRKKGIARRLIKKFISDWKKSRFKEVQLMSLLKLEKFYKKVNFKPSMVLMKYKLK